VQSAKKNIKRKTRDSLGTVPLELNAYLLL